MSLRNKTLLIILSTFAVLFSILFAVSMKILIKSYENLEESSVNRECRLIMDIILNELDQLNIKAGDWAVWDDTGDFINNLNRGYITSNLTENALEILDINFMLFVNNAGRIVYTIGYDSDKRGSVSAPSDFYTHFEMEKKFLKHNDISTTFTGIIRTEGRTALVASRPVLSSLGEGPQRGTLVWGRFIDEKLLSKISGITRVNASMFSYEGSNLPDDIIQAEKLLIAKGPVIAVPRDQHTVDGYLLIRDIYGNPVTIIKVELSRDVFRQGMSSLGHFIVFILATGLVFIISSFFIMEKMVLRRIIKLNRGINKIKQSADLNYRLEENGSDEISSLSAAINRMLEAIKIATEKAVQTEERLSVTMRSISEGVITINRAKNIILMNPVAEVLTGWSKAECDGEKIEEIFQIADDKGCINCDEFFEKIFITGKIVSLPVQSRLIDKNGKERFIDADGSPVFDGDNCISGAVIVFRDISEKMKMQEEVLRAQKLDSIQTLAGGIAHDFNNILTSILGNISILKFKERLKDESLDIVKETERACFRARDLTVQLLTFSKGGSPVRKNSSITEILKETAAFTLRGSNVKSRLIIQEDLWSVEIDESQIHQVINNLIINADQSMPDGGEIEVTAENVILADYPELQVKSFPHIKPGEYVRVSIKDYGTGISKENINRIFDPYFTTKEHGNGLGLSIVYSIIKKHDGHLDVESEEGKGTVFYIYLPSAGSVITVKSSEGENYSSGKGDVLIMDDDDLILQSLGKMLKYLGYDVVTAGSGGEAVEKYSSRAASGNPFHIVIMDLTVPGEMGGKEAVKRILNIDPDAKVIVSSGYSNDPVMSDYEKFGFKGVISKPYNIEMLSKVLERFSGNKSHM